MSFSAAQKDTSGSQTTSLDPQLASTLYGAVDRAQGLADTPFQPYTGQRVAAFTPTQLQAQSALTSIGTGQTGAAPLQSAIGLAQTAGGYAPQAIDPGAVNAATASYMNPYTGAVIGSSLQDLQRQQQIQDQADASKATQAGAFGGSRSAVLQNLDDDSYARAAASTAAGLNQANYGQAQSAALQSAQANQSAGLQGAALNLNAANALAGMGNDELSQSLQRAGALQTAGNTQQQNQQAQLDAAYQQWQLAQQYPIQMQGVLDQAAGLLPTNLETVDQTGQSDSYGINDSLGDPQGLVGNSVSPASVLSFFGL